MQSNFIPVILAGGSGSELYPLCEKYPKCLLPLNNQPLIIYQLQKLSLYGYTNALILAGKNATKIDRYLKEYYHGNVKCDVMSLPEDKKETTQAIRYAANKINRDFILIACDTIADVNFDEIVENHILSGAALTAVLKEDKISTETSKVINPSSLAEGHDVFLLSSETNSKSNPAILHVQPFQDIKANGLKIKKAILAVHPQAAIKTNLVDAHIYVCSHKLLKVLDGLDKKIAESLESWKDDLLPFLVRNQFNEELISILKQIENSAGDCQGANEKNGSGSGSNNKAKMLLINAFVAQNEYIRRAVSIKDYFQANFDCLLQTDKPATESITRVFQDNGVKLLNLPKNTDAKILSSNIAENTNLGAKVQITKSLVGQNCTIGDGVKISNSIIMKDVVIEQGCVLQNCIVGNKANIQQNCELKDCWMGLSAFVEANSQLSGEVVVQYEN